MQIGDKIFVEAVISQKVENAINTYYCVCINQYDIHGFGNLTTSTYCHIIEKYNNLKHSKE